MANSVVNVGPLVASACFALCAIVVLAAINHLTAAGVIVAALAPVWITVQIAIKSNGTTAKEDRSSENQAEPKRDKKRGAVKK